MKPVAFIRTSPEARSEPKRGDVYTNPLSLDEQFVVHPAATFFVRVGEDVSCVEELEVRTGDVLVVDRVATPMTGSMVLVVLDGDFALARYGHVELAGACSLWGTVIALARTF